MGWYDRTTGRRVDIDIDRQAIGFNPANYYDWKDDADDIPGSSVRRFSPTGGRIPPASSGLTQPLNLFVGRPVGYEGNTDPVYAAYVRDTAPQDRSPEAFIEFKSTHGKNGEWLSPEQIYQKRQFEALQNEEKLNNELEPFILESMGLHRNPATGKIEKLPPKPLTPDQLFEQELENLYKDYLGKAQAGELPVSLATEKTLGEQEEILNEAQSRRLGSGWRESTPGIKQAGNFMLTSEATKEAERHGDLNTATGLLNQRQASLSDMTQRRLGLMEGMGSPTYSLVNAYGQGQQPYLFNNLLTSRYNIQDSVNRAGTTAGKYQLAGTAIGALGTAYAYSQYNKTPDWNDPYNRTPPQPGQPYGRR